MQFLAAIQFARSIWPALETLYGIVRDAMPAGSPGAAKMDQFKAAVVKAAELENLAAPALDIIWPLIEHRVAGIHAANKAAGTAEPAAPAA